MEQSGESRTAECAIRHSGEMACTGSKSEDRRCSGSHKRKTPTIFRRTWRDGERLWGPHRIRVKYNETVPEIQPCAVYKYTAQSLRHKRQLVAGLKNTPYNAVHWSQLAPEEQIRFWEDYEAGRATTFLVEPERKRTKRTKRTKRRRGEHSTKPKCENPSWYRPERYKALSGQLGHAYNRLVKKDPVTGEQSLRMHMSLHPFYVQKRTYAGRKYAFRPEKQRLLDAIWPVLVSFSDAGTHTVGMSVSRLAREISPKDSKGKVIPELEVTVSRLSRLLAEQVRFGVLGVSEETMWDRETRQRLPRYVWITPAGWQMLGVDMVKLHEQQQKRLRESEIRQQLIREGVLREDEDISVHAARKRWYLQRSQDALKHRRAKAAASKRARRLKKLPADQQIYEMAEYLRKRLPPDEAYFCSDDHLKRLAIRELRQLELTLAASPPH